MKLVYYSELVITYTVIPYLQISDPFKIFFSCLKSLPLNILTMLITYLSKF
jgi:hypothetical protein